MLALMVYIVAQSGLPLWPRPAHSEWSAGCVRLPSDGPKLTASGPGASSDVTTSALLRYEAILRTELASPPDDLSLQCQSSAPLLHSVNVHVRSNISNPHLNIDESFLLNISNVSAQPMGIIEAETPFGALYGLEALSQLVRRSADGPVITASKLSVRDHPRFPWRG